MACNPCKTKLSNAYINTSKGQLKFELEFKTSKGQRLEISNLNLGSKGLRLEISAKGCQENACHILQTALATLLDNMKGSLSCIRWIKIM